MALYRFKCPSCGSEKEYLVSMLKAPKRSICRCGTPRERDYRQLQFGLFKPYTEENITGQPIRIETAAQRDKLLKDNHLTCDSFKYWQKPVRKTAIEDLTLDEVRKEASENPRAGAEVERGPIAPVIAGHGVHTGS